MRGIYMRLPEHLVNVLDQKAEELGISRSSLIRSILEQAVKMERVLCPECDCLFWAEPGWERCPRCGLKYGEEKLNKFIVQ